MTIKRATLILKRLLLAVNQEAPARQPQEVRIESPNHKLFCAAMVPVNKTSPNWLEEIQAMIDRSGEVVSYGPGIPRQLAPPLTIRAAMQWPFALSVEDRRLLKALKIGTN